ncbi:MAG TPA: hypothetical protein VFC51_10490 [Chloroflexota bacterium]|nr:hypothetical protein [Chloroflexota bacterium]
MHVHRNEALVRSRLRIGAVFLLVSMAVLLGGFIASTRQADVGEQFAISVSTLLIGLVLWWRNQAYLARWGPRNQYDSQLAGALRGLDARYHLFAFPAARLPDYVLVGPIGVLVLVPRAVGGNVVCDGERWSHDVDRPALLRLAVLFSGRPTLGNPGADAERAVRDLRAFLSERLGSEVAAKLEIEPLVVLINSQVKLMTHGCAVAALYLRTLRAHVRKLPRSLPQEAIGEIVRALEAA